jgi:ferredoxin-NADP reductase
VESSVRAGDVLDVSEPRGNFTLQQRDGPIVLLSAGIGATPLLAMLHALAESASSSSRDREVWWLHGARNRKLHSFAAEVRQLLGSLARSRSRVWYSKPDADDRMGQDYDALGRLGVKDLEELHVPRDGDFYLCGPSSFFDDLTTGLTAWGVPADRIHSEIFAGGPSLMPGVVSSAKRSPHQPSGAPGTGPLVSFARSGITVRWRTSKDQNLEDQNSQDQSLLELAEACDVPVRWSCRTGVCHNCESGLISGTVDYQPDPLDAPAEGNILICCARPRRDVVIDL